MEIDNIKDVLGKIMTINKNLNENSLRNLLTASNWDIDDINQAIGVFKYYNDGKESVVVDKEKEKSELYTELRNKDLLNKQEELDRVKSKIKDDLLSKEVDFYLNDIISNVIDDDYLNKLNTEINTLKDNLLSWKSSPEYTPYMTQEKVLNKKIDIITAELEKAKKILEENNNKKSSELDLRKNMEIFDNDNKVNEIKEDVKVFIKENTQQPTESLISNNSDVLEIKNNNQNTSTNEPYQYNTMILAFLDAMLILLIIVIILYIIIN